MMLLYFHSEIFVLVCTQGLALMAGFFFICADYQKELIDDEEHENVINILKTFGLILILSVSSKLWIDKKDVARGIGVLEKCKRDYKMVYGGITLLTVITHFVIIIWSRDANMILYITSICLFSSCVLQLAFTIDNIQYSYLYPCFIFPSFNYYIHFIIIIFCLVFFSLLDPDCHFYMVLFAQILLTFTNAPCISYCYDALGNRIELLETPGQEETRRWDNRENPESEDSDDDDETRILRYKASKCKICFHGFNGKSKKRTPRILRECGHSACTDCLKSLLLNALSEGILECPFCGKFTFSEENTAESLPKNYGTIGLLEEIEEEQRANLSKRRHSL